MWFDGITNSGTHAKFNVYQRGINESRIAHQIRAPIQMRVTRQHLLEVQGFLTSISRAFTTSGNATIDLSHSINGP